MAEPSTVARPYAEAAFKLADESGALAKWSEMLGALALVAADERVRAAASDPNVRLDSGVLESSNVNTASAMVNMIELARQFEMQVKAIRTAEETAASASQLMRLG